MRFLVGFLLLLCASVFLLNAKDSKPSFGIDNQVHKTNSVLSKFNIKFDLEYLKNTPTSNAVNRISKPLDHKPLTKVSFYLLESVNFISKINDPVFNAQIQTTGYKQILNHLFPKHSFW